MQGVGKRPGGSGCRGAEAGVSWAYVRSSREAVPGIETRGRQGQTQGLAGLPGEETRGDLHSAGLLRAGRLLALSWLVQEPRRRSGVSTCHGWC